MAMDVITPRWKRRPHRFPRPLSTAATLFILLLFSSSSTSASTSAGPHTSSSSLPVSPSIDIVIGIDGGTESIRACCFDAHTGSVVGSSHAVPYETYHPQAGWAEQTPEDWYNNACEAVRGALASLKDGDDVGGGGGDLEHYNVKALCCDTTCCSVVALSSSHKPLRPCLLWMDARSAKQAAQIMTVANSHAASLSQTVLEAFPELRVNSNGEGPISAEWLLPKAMWIKQNEPEIWKDAEVICEYQDYLNYRLTGKMVASSCNAAVRWHHDGWEVLQSTGEDEHRGRPMRLYEVLDMEDLADKLPKRTLAMGEVVGGLTEEAARDMGLPVGTSVVQGGADAFVGMIGLGTIRPHQTCLITGSSHLHCLVSPSATSAPGTWGAYRGAPLPHLNLCEGGQSSTGRLVRWVRDLISSSGEEVSYRVLDEEAGETAPGCDGLVALETWQGSRTPHTDPLARGAFVGLTLSHNRAHMFRAILESVCFGTRACFDALEVAAAEQSTDTETSAESKDVVIAGGATRSPLWLQLHADITNKKLVINENTDGPLLGCAILASVGAGIYNSVDDAVANMVRRERTIEPRKEVAEIYDRLYREVYGGVGPATKDLFHALAKMRGGGEEEMTTRGSDYFSEKLGLGDNRKRCGKWGVNCLGKVLRGGGTVDGSNQQQSVALSERRSSPIISPSLLASDWSDIKGEIQKCLDAGLTHIHVDVFDGVYLDSPYALTFGPQMVECIRQRFGEGPGQEEDGKELTLDVHLCVYRPERYAEAMAKAGATRIIFQWEAMMDVGDAESFARTITSLGMECGISINPDTDVVDIFPLLNTGLVDLVDVLAVEPGFGGQEFNPVAIKKIERLRRDYSNVVILVDGGINQGTSKSVVDAGADILVAGTALFRHSQGFEQAVKELL